MKSLIVTAMTILLLFSIFSNVSSRRNQRSEAKNIKTLAKEYEFSEISKPFQDGLTKAFQGITVEKNYFRETPKCNKKLMSALISGIYEYFLSQISSPRKRDTRIPYINDRDECYGDNVMCYELLSDEYERTKAKLKVIEEEMEKGPEYEATVAAQKKRIAKLKRQSERLKKLNGFFSGKIKGLVAFKPLNDLIKQFDEMKAEKFMKSLGEKFEECFDIEGYLNHLFGSMHEKGKVFPSLTKDAYSNLDTLQKVKMFSRGYFWYFASKAEKMEMSAKVIHDLVLPEILKKTAYYKVHFQIY